MPKKNGFRCSVESAPFRAALALLCFVALAIGSNLSIKRISSDTTRQVNDAQPIGMSVKQEPRTTSSKTEGAREQSFAGPGRSLGLTPSPQIGEFSNDGLWQFTNEASLVRALTDDQKARAAAPQSHKTARLNRDALTELLRQAPMEFTDSANRNPFVMTLPMPDGTFARFRVEESPIMEPGLADQFPEIKTYQAQGIDDPTATSRFDWTPLGLHAIVLSALGTSFVEPLSEDDTTNYITYFNHDVSTDKLSLSCQLSESEIADAENRGVRMSQLLDSANFVTGSTLRTYRLAVAATGEFTQQYGGGDVTTTLMKITTLINPVSLTEQYDPCSLKPQINNRILSHSKKPDHQLITS